MESAWREVMTQPLGIAGYALFLVFGVVAVVAKRKGRKDQRWVIAVGFAIAVLCIAGGFGLAFQHELSAVKPPSAVPAATTMRIDKIEQEGNASVAGVQGSVEISHSDKGDPKRGAQKRNLKGRENEH